MEHPIKDVRYSPTEKSPKHFKGKSSRFDLACELDSGTQAQIEVQFIDQKTMERRSLCYWSQSYLDHFESVRHLRNLRSGDETEAFQRFEHQFP